MESWVRSLAFAVIVFSPVLLAYFSGYGLLRLARRSPRPGRFDAEARALGWMGLATLPAILIAYVYYAPEIHGGVLGLVLAAMTVWFIAFGGATSLLVTAALSSSYSSGLGLLAFPLLTTIQTLAITAWLTSRARRTTRPFRNWAWVVVAVLHCANAGAGLFMINRLDLI